MDKETIEGRLRNHIDELAAVEHDRWAHWQRYMHGKGEIRSDGSLLLPPDLVKRWEEQMATAYAALSEVERESDRDQVRRYLPLVADILSR